LESSNQGEIREAISFENGAMCITRIQGKKIGYRAQLSDFRNDKMNWQFMRHYAGPTIQLKQLLA
jgi:hypothetical protein